MLTPTVDGAKFSAVGTVAGTVVGSLAKASTVAKFGTKGELNGLGSALSEGTEVIIANASELTNIKSDDEKDE